MEKSSSPPRFDPSLFPRNYTISGGWKVFLLLFGFGFTGLGLFLAWKYFDDPGARNALAFAISGTLSLALGFYIIGDTLLSKVILFADAIEVHDLMPVRRMERADMKGRMLLDTGQAGGKTVVFVPNDSAGKKLKLPMIMRTDDVLKQWVETLPDLDFAEKEESVREILEDTDGGATREQRIAALLTAKRTARSLNITTGIACVAGYFLAGYYPVTILLAVLPWWALALAARSPGLYSLNDHRNDLRAGVGLPLIMPGFILFLGCLLNYHLLDWMPLHAAAAAIALLITFLATRVDVRLIQKKTVFLVLPLMFPYGYGALISADALADFSPPKIYETRVISQHYTSGKGAHPELEIEPWGPDPGGDVAVSGALYKAVHPGGTVCVHLHKGALGVPWYYLDICHL